MASLTKISKNKERVEGLLSLINSSARSAMSVYESTGNDIPSLNSPHPLDNEHELLALKKVIRLLEGACNQLCNTLSLPADTMSHRFMLFEPACLRLVAEAHIPDILIETPEGSHVDDIAKRVRMDSHKLARVLRLLSMKGCFNEVTPNVFANNRLSLTLLSSNPIFDAIGVWMNDYRYVIVDLFEATTHPDYAYSHEPSRSPFMYAKKDEVKKENAILFDWYQLNPLRRERFGRAMVGWSNMTGSISSLKSPVWSSLPDGSLVCDIGSGIGGFTIQLAKAHPQLKVTLCDLPEVIGQAKEFWSSNYPEAVQKGRVEFVSLDFFQEAVKGHDVYYARHIIHNWLDPNAVLILQNIRKVMHSKSRVFIQECVLPHQDEEDFTKNGKRIEDTKLSTQAIMTGSDRQYNLDMTMLTVLNSRERTLNEYKRLGEKAGLAFEKNWEYEDTSLLEFRLAECET